MGFARLIGTDLLTDGTKGTGFVLEANLAFGARGALGAIFLKDFLKDGSADETEGTLGTFGTLREAIDLLPTVNAMQMQQILNRCGKFICRISSG